MDKWEAEKMRNLESDVTRLTARVAEQDTEIAALRELLDAAMVQLQLEDDLDPHEPCPERDQIIHDIRASIDEAREDE